MSQFELLAQSARSLEGTFGIEALVVKAWRDNPGVFSLGDYPYPDSNKVKVLICGKRGLVAKGELIKVAPNTYRAVPNSKDRRPPEEYLALYSLMETEAWKLYESGKRGEITFLQACEFWGCRPKLIDLRPIEKVLADLSAGFKREISFLQSLHEWLKEKFHKQIQILQKRETA